MQSNKVLDSNSNQLSSLKNIEKITLWLKTTKNPDFPKFYNSSMHFLKEENCLLIISKNQNIPTKLSILLMNLSNYSIETIQLSNQSINENNFDTNMLHYQSILHFTNKIYLFKNAPLRDDETVFIADIKSKKLFPIRNNELRPANFRINYTINLYQTNKIFFFGGLNVENFEPLNVLDTYDITTYLWEVVKTKGKAPSPRHSHSAIIINDILYIVGGTTCSDLFQNEGKLDDLYLLDLTNYSWTPIKTFGNIPRLLGYNYTTAINDKKLLILWSERGFNESSFEISVSLLDLVNYEWENFPLLMKQPEYRHNAGFCYDNSEKIIYYYGGFYFNKNDANCISNELDKLKIFDQKDLDSIEKYKLFNGENFNIKNINFKIDSLKDINKAGSSTNLNKANDINIDDDEISFEELLEREKKLQEEEKIKLENKKNKKKKSKKKNK